MHIDDLDIGIIAALSDGDPTYSLTSVIADQCKILDIGGIKYTLYVNENFNFSKIGVLDEIPIKAEMPIGTLEQDIINNELSMSISSWLSSKIHNIFITHDLMFQAWFITHNDAIRDVISKKTAKWLHWQHSGPGSAHNEFPAFLRTSLAPQSIYVLPDESELQIFAESLRCSTDNVYVCYNPLDLLEYHRISNPIKKILRDRRSLDSDIMQLFPFSTPRWRPKGVHKVISIFGEFKRLGYKISLILANAHPNGNKIHIEEISKLISDEGISDETIITSEYGLDGLDKEDIKSLFCITDIFVFPSVSETCSLVLLEASAGGNLIVPNADSPPIMEFADLGLPAFRFGSIRQTTKYGQGEEKWLADVAKEILPALQRNTALKQKRKIRKYHNYERILREQLLPILLPDL